MIVGTSPQISQRFTAQAIPTLLVMRRGQVIARQTGAAPLAALRTRADNALAAPLAEHCYLTSCPSWRPAYYRS